MRKSIELVSVCSLHEHSSPDELSPELIMREYFRQVDREEVKMARNW